MGIIGGLVLLGVEATKDDSFISSYRRTYRVFATTDVDEDYIINNLGIGIYTPHPSNSNSVVKNIVLGLENPNIGYYDSNDNPGNAGTPPTNGTPCYVYTVSVEYGPRVFGASETDDPLAAPGKVFYDGNTIEEIADVDIDGKPIVNTAFDFFDPPVTREKTYPVIRVLKNVGSFSGYLVSGYADKVNGAAIGSYAARTLKCGAPRAQPMLSPTGIEYYEVEFVFQFNELTWDDQPLNQGYRELDPSDATKRRHILVEGMFASFPVLLDADGYALLPPVDDTNVNYLRFKKYQELDYSVEFASFPANTFT